jgi:hypothetical protein
MRHRRHGWFVSRAALAMFAIVVQTLLPFVLAAAIVGSADATPICHVAPGNGHDKGRQPDPGHPCPICTALAASALVTTPTLAAIPLPQTSIRPVEPTISQVSAETSRSASYRSRAPPRA